MPTPHDAPFVVLANDDESQLALMVGLLADQGLDLLPCHTVAQALDAIMERAPALIITDLYMPGIDGWTFCRLLRSAAYREFNATPIVVTSGTFPGEDAAAIAAELGANGFLPAPLDAHSLRECVRSLLRAPAPAAPWRVLLLQPPGPELEAASAVFTAHGCEVNTCASVAEFADRVAAGPWDNIVCDVDLPGSDLSLVAKLVALAPRSSFIVTTVNADPGAAVASLRAGAGLHLRRPFAPDYLFGLCELARQQKSLLRAQRLLERRTIDLHNSQRLLNAILDSSDQVYLVIDAAGRIELANDAAGQIAEEIGGTRPRPGDSALGVLPPGMRERVMDALALALSGRVLQHDASVVDRAGRPRRFLVRYTPLKGPDGRAERVCFNAHDITARTEAENALRLRNHALSSISQGVLIGDADQRITYANQGFLDITGYTLPEVVGRDCGFLQGEGTDPATREAIHRALAEDRPFHGEILNYRKDGQPFWNDLSITPVRDDAGRVTQYVSVQRDVTARKRHEEDLRASQTRLQALFDHSNDAILLADDQGRYIDANPAACRLLGYSRAELLALDVPAVFSSGDRSWAEAAWREFIQRGRQAGECTLVRRDGSSVRADYSAIARILPGVHLSILRDLSERHTLQSQLLRQQRLESVGRLASGVAHDLNNILTPILMAPAMLRMHVADAGARMLLETIETGARRGSAIVRQLLAFARGDAGEKIRVDLQKVLRDARAIIQETFPKQITLDFPAAAGEFPVLGDSTQLQQVVLNLALNGADAMPRGGRLVFGLDRAELTEADAERDPEIRPGRHVVLTVADHGTGIAPEHLDKIFDPFFTTKPFGQGSGLGLSVVLGIVRGHDGFIRVTSRVGVGTIMKVHLPLRADPPPPAAPAPPSAETALPSGAGRTVLVVDDEANVRDIVRLILSREGYKVMCADGADAAFSQMQSVGGRLDLVLTDMAMPGVSGAKFVELLLGRRADLPILVMTGTDVEHVLPPDIRALARGVILKPFDATTLLHAVQNAIAPLGGKS